MFPSWVVRSDPRGRPGIVAVVAKILHWQQPGIVRFDAAAAAVSAVGHSSSTRIDPTFVGPSAFVVALLPVGPLAPDPAAAAAPSAFLSFAAKSEPNNRVPSSNRDHQQSHATVPSCCWLRI